MKYFIKTFGCQQNVADSERIASAFKARSMSSGKNYLDSNYVVVNTCMIRQSAEDRVYGLVRNLGRIKEQKTRNKEFFKIIVTGCMVGLAFRDKTGKYLQRIRMRMPQVDEFMPIEEVGFDNQPVRQNSTHGWVPISNGCNNFCTFCVVPFTRGREISRPFHDILNECLSLNEKGYKEITLLGQNVNSYGADLVKNSKVKSQKLKPIYVKHLGRLRIPTLFPYLLEAVSKIGFEKISFYSSNPWDFSDELIDIIVKNENITRTIHLPVQSGDDELLKKMNRWYTTEQYLALISKIKNQISNIKFTTDIIVGFCGETEKQFQNTVDLVKKAGFSWAYVSMYSQRPMTAATKVFKDDVPYEEKKRRWQVLENLINKPHLNKNRHS